MVAHNYGVFQVFFCFFLRISYCVPYRHTSSDIAACSSHDEKQKVLSIDFKPVKHKIAGKLQYCTEARQMEKPRESIRDFVIRQNVNEALNNKLRSRSSSLPRIESTDLNEIQYRLATTPLRHQYDPMRNLAIGSLDNLTIDYDSPNKNSLRRRRLPVAPLLGDLEESFPVLRGSRVLVHNMKYWNMGPGDLEVSFPVLRGNRVLVRNMKYWNMGPGARITSREIPPVRAVLVALDQCGFRTVMVEKTQPGPFGFYIATGVMNGQRGIFISRVSIPSLSPMLSVGDEILYVDDQLVRGRSLETVQTLIAGKTKVLIVLLPAIGKFVY
ncbi:unnamed protein product [Nippostrongylus brasiliensis]|uniref:PDZ domain-containing protein n=1 Tax=Nippostrongylus brasiliensis TaxID=27835 RepID=A0A3P7B3W0_NIPBR|nr:unnamed protein product [Nippostrongylus brasiliensis]